MESKIYYEVQVWENLKGWQPVLETFDLEFANTQAYLRWFHKKQDSRVVRFSSSDIIYYHSH